MKKTTHVVLTVLLLLTTFPVFAADKNVAKPKGPPDVVRVGGQVTRPGEIPYRDNTTIFAMIFAAGGPNQFATLRRVKIVRDGKSFQLDLTKEKAKNHEFAHPDDYIEVPQKNILGR